VEIVRSLLILRTVCNQQAGFTFNEILVAMNLVVIAILGYSLSTVGVIRGNMTNDNSSVAINLAQDKMEQLKTQKQLVNDDQCPSSGDHAIAATGAPNGIFEHTHQKEGWRKEVEISNISAAYYYTHALDCIPNRPSSCLSDPAKTGTVSVQG